MEAGRQGNDRSKVLKENDCQLYIQNIILQNEGEINLYYEGENRL